MAMASSKIQKKRKNIGSFKTKAFALDKDTYYDVYEMCYNSKEKCRKETGVTFDNEMAIHKCLWDSTYPECPERYTEVIKRCEELGLLSRCIKIENRLANEEEILVKHSPEHLNLLKETNECQDTDLLEEISSRFDSIYIHPKTYQIALKAVGSTIELVDAICKNEIQNGMAIIRPPGHHAMKSEYCGYCYFNNVALAAQHALQNYNISKILIVDWDVHHGQATQQMFYEDPRVVYFSIHRYENGKFWPNLRESDFNFIGDGDGRGYNFNVPLNVVGLGNADYLSIFHNILLPLTVEFKPELIFVSAGYDAAIGCPEGEMLVTPACYAHLIASLTGFANGKLAVILEGGYCLKSLAEGAALTLRALLGDPCPLIGALEAPHWSVRETILNVIYSHRNYWKCFKLQGTYSVSETDPEKSKSFYLPKVNFEFDGPYLKKFPTRNCYPVQSNSFVEDTNEQINKLILATQLLSPTHKVCFVYDTLMLEHKNCFEDHPEKPERISESYKLFEDYNLVDRLHKLPSRCATYDDLLTVHTEKYIEKIKYLQNVQSKKEFQKLASKYDSVYFHSESFSSACWASGSLLQVVDSVLNGESASGIALIRPPGHHASEEEACGFCIFNNVSIAANYAINVRGLTRILILDWDIHHGNGTQQIFYSDPKVLYISVHRFSLGKFFPSTSEGDYLHIGDNQGKGYNVNIPWTERGMGNDEYAMAFYQVILPIAYQFNPELVLISAGFDAAVNDPLGGCKVTPDAYGHFTRWMMPLAGGKIILCLEGGYNIRSVSYALTMCTKALLDDPLPISEFGKNIKNSAVMTVRKVVEIQRQYWSALDFAVQLPKEDVLLPYVGDVLQSEFKENQPCCPATPFDITKPSSLDDDLKKAFSSMRISDNDTPLETKSVPCE